VVFPADQDAIYPGSRALSRSRGVVGLRGDLASEGAIVNIRGIETADGRTRHGRDIVDNQRGLRATYGRSGRLHHRRTLLRRDAWFLRRSCPIGGRGGSVAWLPNGERVVIDAVAGHDGSV
jgi:hypothetical protein